MSQPMTIKGAEKLKEELRHLKSVERPRITKAIAEARAHGDLSENAEYHAAREQQSFTEGRINHIDSVLAEAQIIDVTELDAGGRVVFGATVELLNVENDKEVTYQIVGEEEADEGLVLHRASDRGDDAWHRHRRDCLRGQTGPRLP